MFGHRCMGTMFCFSLALTLVSSWKVKSYGTSFGVLVIWSHTLYTFLTIPKVSYTSFTRSSKHPANAFKIHVHDVCSNCSMFAWRLLHVGYALCMLHICLAFARCLLDVCSMFAWLCKWGITLSFFLCKMDSRQLEFPYYYGTKYVSMLIG